MEKEKLEVGEHWSLASLTVLLRSQSMEPLASGWSLT